MKGSKTSKCELQAQLGPSCNMSKPQGSPRKPNAKTKDVGNIPRSTCQKLSATGCSTRGPEVEASRIPAPWGTPRKNLKKPKSSSDPSDAAEERQAGNGPTTGQESQRGRQPGSFNKRGEDHSFESNKTLSAKESSGLKNCSKPWAKHQESSGTSSAKDSRRPKERTLYRSQETSQKFGGTRNTKAPQVKATRKHKRKKTKHHVLGNYVEPPSQEPVEGNSLIVGSSGLQEWEME